MLNVDTVSPNTCVPDLLQELPRHTGLIRRFN